MIWQCNRHGAAVTSQRANIKAQTVAVDSHRCQQLLRRRDPEVWQRSAPIRALFALRCSPSIFAIFARYFVGIMIIMETCMMVPSNPASLPSSIRSSESSRRLHIWPSIAKNICHLYFPFLACRTSFFQNSEKVWRKESDCGVEGDSGEPWTLSPHNLTCGILSGVTSFNLQTHTIKRFSAILYCMHTPFNKHC